MSQISLSEAQRKALMSLSFTEPKIVTSEVSAHTADSLRVRGFIVLVEDNKIPRMRKYLKTERVLNVKSSECKN
jgi:hypothetical protein